MAQTRFKLNSQIKVQEVTHAHRVAKEEKLTPADVKGSTIFSGVNLSMGMIKFLEILSSRQKQQLINYAQTNDKTAGSVIKEVLIQKGIIEE